jgi:hypothetical protein
LSARSEAQWKAICPGLFRELPAWSAAPGRLRPRDHQTAHSTSRLLRPRRAHLPPRSAASARSAGRSG